MRSGYQLFKTSSEQQTHFAHTSQEKLRQKFQHYQSVTDFTLIVISIVHSSIDIVEFLDEFYETIVGFVLLPGEAGVFPIPTIVVVVFVVMFLTLVNNFTFLRKIDIPERKRNGIAFLTAIVNAPWHLFIPYSLFIKMIFFNEGAAYA